MKKTLFAFLFTCCSLFFSPISSFAGEWKLDDIGYWYQNDDFTYPVSGWQWIDGNLDGIYECYCFDDNGYLFTDTMTPDNSIVDANGAWIVDGVVQIQSDDSYDDSFDLTNTLDEADFWEDTEDIVEDADEDSSASGASGISLSPYEGYSIIVNTSTQKYHVIGCRAIKQMNDENKGYADNESYLIGLGYQPCKICH